MPLEYSEWPRSSHPFARQLPHQSNPVCKTLTLQQPAHNRGVNKESSALASDGDVLQIGEYVQCNRIITGTRAKHKQVIEQPNGAGAAGAWT